MSRPRLTDAHLPRRMYRHGRAYRLTLDGRNVPLGRDFELALRRYYVIMGQPATLLPAVHEEAMWKRHRKGAKQRGIEFSITVEDVQTTLEDQGRVCAITALAFNLDKPTGMRIRPWAPSIDRIDASKGYEPGNIRVVCAFVNVAMNGFGESFFHEVLGSLVDAAIKARQHMSESGEPKTFDPNLGTAREYDTGRSSSHAELASANASRIN